MASQSQNSNYGQTSTNNNTNNVQNTSGQSSNTQNNATQPIQNNQHTNKDTERTKEISYYAMQTLQLKTERKHHLEIKSLYILQATAVLITLFVGFQDKIGNIPEGKMQSNYIFFRNGFYICILVALVALLLSLFDLISGDFDDVQYPDVLCFEYPQETTLVEYYEEQVRYLSISIKSVDKIIRKKILFYNIGLTCFIFAIILLIIIGFIFV